MTLAILRHEEGVRVDADRIVAIFSEVDRRQGEQALAHTIAKLSARLAAIERDAARGDREALIQGLGRLIGLAEGSGMVTMARVARHVQETARVGDETARAATLARLRRIGVRSLAAVRDLRDLTV